MKALLQRVERAAVRVDGASVGSIGAGVLVFLGVEKGDDERVVARLAQRVATFRFFPDADDRMNLDVVEAGASALVVSQFTLAHTRRKGRRPSFDRAAAPALAEALYEAFVADLRARGIPTETGRFAARMAVELVNDGPVTFLLEEPPEAPVEPG